MPCISLQFQSYQETFPDSLLLKNTAITSMWHYIVTLVDLYRDIRIIFQIIKIRSFFQSVINKHEKMLEICPIIKAHKVTLYSYLLTPQQLANLKLWHKILKCYSILREEITYQYNYIPFKAINTYTHIYTCTFLLFDNVAIANRKTVQNTQE